MNGNVKLILLVFFLAAVVRLAYLFENSSSPLFAWPVLDEQSLDASGQEIAAGNFERGTDCFRAPLYPLFLGAVYSISHDNRFFVLRVVQHLLGALTCLFVFMVATEAFGRRAGIAAGILAACYAPMVFFEGTILTETLFIFLIAFSLAGLVLGVARTSRPLLLAGGLALGLAAVTRPNILVFAPVAILWLVFLPARNGWRQRVVRTGLVLLPLILVIGLSSARNYYATGDFVLISSQGGANFYLGNGAGASGMPPPTRMVYGTSGRIYSDAVEASSTEAVERLMDSAAGNGSSATQPAPTVSPAAVSAVCYRATLAHINGNRIEWLKLMVRKLVLFWNDFEIPNVKDFYFWKQSSVTLSVLPISFGTLSALGLLGAIVTIRRQTPGAALVNLYVLSFMAGIILFFVCARLRLPVIVGLLPLAGAGIVAMIDTIGTRAWRNLAS
ncbi:MAG: glycosyltransferase family 39 protein, partial [bacterium]